MRAEQTPANRVQDSDQGDYGPCYGCNPLTIDGVLYHDSTCPLYQCPVFPEDAEVSQ